MPLKLKKINKQILQCIYILYCINIYIVMNIFYHDGYTDTVYIVRTFLHIETFLNVEMTILRIALRLFQ